MEISDQLTQGVEVLIAGQVVANDIVGLPASKQREARPDLHLHWILQNLQMGGGDVADLVPVVHILCRGRKDGLLRRKRGQSLTTNDHTEDIKANSETNNSDYNSLIINQHTLKDLTDEMPLSDCRW